MELQENELRQNLTLSGLIAWAESYKRQDFKLLREV
jgi:hypothetical protein